MNENERASRLADDLDLAPQDRPSYEPQTLPEDRPLLQLADHLSGRTPLAPTPAERAEIRRRIRQIQQARKSPGRPTSRFLLALKPVLQASLWAVLLVGVFVVAALLVADLLGSPERSPAGPAPVPAEPTVQHTATAEPAPTDPEPARSAFPVQAQEANGVRMELREVAGAGDNLRATLCYTPPDQKAWRLENVELAAGESVLPFYPSSSARPAPGEDGLACETFTAARPGGSPAGAWTVTARRLTAPRESMPDCDRLNQQLAQEMPGLSVTCDTGGGGFAVQINPPPEETDLEEAQRLVQIYFETEVHGGPWTFAFDAGDIAPLITDGAPPAPVVVPSACDPDVSRLDDGGRGVPLDHQARLSGVAGAGTAQSGPFTILLGLACDPGFSRLQAGGDYYSEINGLGILYRVAYQGDPIHGKVQFSSGLVPFVKLSGSSESFDAMHTHEQYEGLHFPKPVRPDFSQSGVRLRYLVKVQTPDGAIEGAALALTLQREPEGYRPVDVVVEPLTGAERQALESDPGEPLPFPTLPAPAPETPAGTQALLNLVNRWQEPLLAAPGWIHLRTRTEMPGGNDLYAGLTEYINDDWFHIDAQRQVIAHIHVDRRPDGTVLQQSYSQDGKTTNLTFGHTGEFKPYPLELAYSVKDILEAGGPVMQSEATLDGRPVILLALRGMATRREAVDAASGAWLYSELVRQQEGDDPFSGGALDQRTTLEVVERVDAPPQEALALLGQAFSGYTPPEPYGTPAPQGYDPSQSKITHHAVPGDDFHSPSFWYGDLYADGYLLGRVDFGAVPGGFCERSADGSKIAFNYSQNDPGGVVLRSELRWFDLRALDVIHRPAPEMSNIGALSWSPGQEKLAVFGCRKDCGLYLLDPATGAIRLLLPGVYAIWQPIWNPDGSQIAFVDTLNAGHTLYVVDIETGETVYQGAFDAGAWQVPAGSPTHAWGVTFPRGATLPRCFAEEE